MYVSTRSDRERLRTRGPIALGVQTWHRDTFNTRASWLMALRFEVEDVVS
jgi:hypothetical protein